MTFLPFIQVNYNAYVSDGRPAVEVTAQKLRLSPPQMGFPRVVVSKEVPEVIEPGRQLLSAMGFHGFANIEFKKDPRDGTYKLMEVNGRHNNSGMLSVRAGVNFPWIMYRHLVQGELPPSGLTQKRKRRPAGSTGGALLLTAIAVSGGE